MRLLVNLSDVNKDNGIEMNLPGKMHLYVTTWWSYTFQNNGVDQSRFSKWYQVTPTWENFKTAWDFAFSACLWCLRIYAQHATLHVLALSKATNIHMCALIEVRTALRYRFLHYVVTLLALGKCHDLNSTAAALLLWPRGSPFQFGGYGKFAQGRDYVFCVHYACSGQRQPWSDHMLYFTKAMSRGVTQHIQVPGYFDTDTKYNYMYDEFRAVLIYRGSIFPGFLSPFPILIKVCIAGSQAGSACRAFTHTPARHA